ncbi:uncharacterized protein LOC131028539 [Cryptomeria japonica]|uniref:uncharacterized protein LOC131028539 n=1 Tax=Cryptomeria japonica TaxID=3369 RepID=UPI0027DA53B9|nr:uncharacterized protein LOC131028539 [Cryptomeria japonica]
MVENMIARIWSSDLKERVERQREREIRQMVEGLPTINISENHIRKIADCPICLFNYEVVEAACHLRCHERHIFHRECIQKWLKTKNQCPICRLPAYKWTYWMEAVGDGEIGTHRFSARVWG